MLWGAKFHVSHRTWRLKPAFKKHLWVAISAKSLWRAKKRVDDTPKTMRHAVALHAKRLPSTTEQTNGVAPVMKQLFAFVKMFVHIAQISATRFVFRRNEYFFHDLQGLRRNIPQSGRRSPSDGKSPSSDAKIVQTAHRSKYTAAFSPSPCPPTKVRRSLRNKSIVN